MKGSNRIIKEEIIEDGISDINILHEKFKQFLNSTTTKKTVVTSEKRNSSFYLEIFEIVQGKVKRVAYSNILCQKNKCEIKQ